MFEVNKIKQKLNSGSTVFGTWSILGSTEAMMVMNSAKLDFIIIDMEHPPTNFETAQNHVFSTFLEDKRRSLKSNTFKSCVMF